MYAISLSTLPEPLRQQLAFVIETDRLKQVLRRTQINGVMHPRLDVRVG